MVSRNGWAALPRDATGLSADCDCGISWSYSLTIFGFYKQERVKGKLVYWTEYYVPWGCLQFVIVVFFLSYSLIIFDIEYQHLLCSSLCPF